MRKYNDLFNKLKRENALATMSLYNFAIYKFTKQNKLNEAKKIETIRRKYYDKIMMHLINFDKYIYYVDKIIDFENNLLYCQDEFRNYLFTDKEFEKLNDDLKKNLRLFKKMESIRAQYSDEEISALNVFSRELTTTFLSVQDGKLVPFEEMPSFVTEGIDYEFSTDVYFNLVGLTNLGNDLSYLYYRSRIISPDMPMFIPKKLKEEYNSKLEKYYGTEAYTFEEFTNCPEFRKVYDLGKHKRAKEQYESVFPEFNFKYEDVENEAPCYEVEFKNYDF